MYEENINFLNFAHFSLPKVKVGSVIEVEYEYSSSTINDWYFQYDIPVVYSEFSAAIDEELFKYNHTVWGYEKVHAVPVEISYETFRPLGGVRTTIKTNIYKFSADTLPAFIKEPYMTTIDNFITKVSFEFRRGFYRGVICWYIMNRGQSLAKCSLVTHGLAGR